MEIPFFLKDVSVSLLKRIQLAFKKVLEYAFLLHRLEKQNGHKSQIFHLCFKVWTLV